MTTTAAGSLTDRYVAATLSQLPGRQRADIERELRTSIADAIEVRVTSGMEPAEAETAVLTDLGDPARLAAQYADRPLYLIGPALFVDYLRLLRILLVTVVPALTAGMAIVRMLQGDTARAVIGATVDTGITTAVHIVCWTTLAFALVDRVFHQRRPAGWRPAQWTPAALPELPSRRMRHAELISVTVALVLFTSLILMSPRLGIQETPDGQPIGVLTPWLWDTGVVYAFIAAVVASLGFAYAKHYLRWSLPLGMTGALVNLAAPTMLIWLALTDRVLNPAFVAAAGWASAVPKWINAALVIISVTTVLHTVGEAVRLARRR